MTLSLKTCIVYPIEDLLKALPGFRLIDIEVKHYSEDENYRTQEHRLTNQPEIISFSLYARVFKKTY